jgi:hypothetical protein
MQQRAPRDQCTVSSLRALLTGIIDYAGLFPPAKLPLDQAIHLYAHHRLDSPCWMLGRFVCPSERLGELAALVPDLFSPASPLRISALGRGGRSVPEFLAGLRTDVDAMAAFRDRHSERAVTDAYEIRVLAEVLVADSSDAAHALLVESGKTLRREFPSLIPYYEAGSGTSSHSSMFLLSTVLANAKRLAKQQPALSEHPAGVKLRCGGPEAADFPSPEQVAFTITACRDAGVLLKFTAGLHHPIRHFNAAIQTHMHGFLNVFTAGVLAHAARLNKDQVRQIIEDQNADDFAFDEAGLRWKDLSASVAQIRAARESAVISFGSCSFEEPCEGLRTMGLLN